MISDQDACAGWEVMKIRKGDIIPEYLAASILKHNKYGRSIGCW